MKEVSIFRMFLLSLVFCLAYPQGSEASAKLIKHDFDKIIEKKFDISPDGLVGIHNKHGKVEIITGSQNTVEIKVHITVEAKNEASARDVFDRIKIEFSNNDNHVNAKTLIETKSGWSSWFGASSNDKFEINYEVHMPATCRLDLSNKYGNSYVGALEASAKADIKYGNIKMEGLTDDLDITIGYGKGTIAKAKDANVNLKYGQIMFDELKDLTIESKYSKIIIGKAVDVFSTSKYDNYKIGDISEIKNTGKYDNFEIQYVDVITSHSKYSDFDISEMATSAEFVLKYSNVEFHSIAPGFASIILEGSYTDFILEFQEGAQFQFDATGNYADIDWRQPLDITYENKEHSIHKIEGYLGQKESPSIVKAALSYGKLKIR